MMRATLEAKREGFDHHLQDRPTYVVAIATSQLRASYPTSDANSFIPSIRSQPDRALVVLSNISRIGLPLGTGGDFLLAISKPRYV